MIFRDTLFACPACGCHFKRGEPRCPHCDAEVEVTRGRVAPTAVALLLGLAAAFPQAGGCSDDSAGGAGGASASASGGGYGASGGGGHDDSSTSNYAVSTYGTGATGGWGGTSITTDATSGNGGAGGEGGQGGAGCGSVADIDASCEACLAVSCCDQLSVCEGDPSCLACMAGDDSSCGNAAIALSLCAHGGCDEACSGLPSSDCNPPLPAPSEGACVDPGAACNPVTNAGCDGAACRPDASGPVCGAASGAVCATCIADVECPASTLCVHDGLLPYLGHCAPLCCADGDCSTGACAPLDASSFLGTCTGP